MPDPLRIYFAGELFSAKHLLGNAVLAEEIFHRSQERYLPVLPQNLEQRERHAHEIRDQDLLTLFDCHVGIFHYDGPELDSGTVVEFCFAKMADIPSVLVRTDFRFGGDQAKDGEPWNLMSSYFPRTKTVVLPSMEAYKDAAEDSGGLGADHLDDLRRRRSSAVALSNQQSAADQLIAALDEVCRMQPVLPASDYDALYRSLALLPGFRAGQERFDWKSCLAEKRKRGLLPEKP
ncbi:MAG: nucleoside 2-deoxyribosyltransferase [Verrucomicrobiales bacterium]